MLDELLKEGWDYHDSQSERLAAELEAAVAPGVPPAQLAAFVHLATHTIGEHLHDWPRAYALARRAVEGVPPGTDIGDASGRLYVAAVMAGDAIGAAQCELRSLKTTKDPLSGVLISRLLLAEALIDNDRRVEGELVLLDALALAEQIERPPNLERRIAATCNNLAWMLHDLSSRTQADVALMRLAAQKSLAAWRRSGDWINVEQALYLEASVAFIAGEPAATLTLSAEGLQVIATNGKRPFDAARFHLLRAASFDALDDPHERQVVLDQADDAAKDIAIERLRDGFLAERAKVTPR